MFRELETNDSMDVVKRTSCKILFLCVCTSTYIDLCTSSYVQVYVSIYVCAWVYMCNYFLLISHNVVVNIQRLPRPQMINSLK